MGQAVKTDPARRTAAQTLFAVLRQNRSVEDSFDAIAGKARLSGQGRALARQISLTTLRQLGRLRPILAALMDKPLAPKARYAESVLLCALGEMLAMRSADHGVVNAAVDLVRADAQTRHLSGLVNAVLRRAGRERETLNFEGRDPLPPRVRARWDQHYGRALTDAMARALTVQPPVDIALKPGVDTAPYTALGGRITAPAAIRFDQVDVPALPGFDAGDFWVQDMAAQIPAALMGDVAGKRILDMCAAPGGKTLQLAAAGAHVTAVDRSAKRLQRLEANLARTSLRADIIAADGLSYTPDTPFDAVLLDAPCSATGTYRRNPDVLWLKSDADIAKLAALQSKLLYKATDWLKPGGTLIYATCALEHSEGEDQIAALLAGSHDFDRVTPRAACLPVPDALTPQGDVRLRPDMKAADGGMDGFFIARLQKRP